MSYENIINEHLRLTILRLLAEDPDYTINDSLLVDLATQFGFGPSRDKVRTTLAWLREQALVTYEDDQVIIATLTERGLDVALGRSVVPGVKRPSPTKPLSRRK